MELVLGILRNMVRHPRLASALASHVALPRAVVECTLCGCEDPVALTAACELLQEACGDCDHVTEEVRARSPHFYPVKAGRTDVIPAAQRQAHLRDLDMGPRPCPGSQP